MLIRNFVMLTFMSGLVTLGGCGSSDDNSSDSPSDSTNAPPVIELIGAEEVSIDIGDAYVEQGATATDPEDGDLTSEIEVSGTVNTNQSGRYDINYSVSDSAGSRAEKKRVVVVNDDDNASNQAPTIQLIGQSQLQLNVGETYNEPGATASDPEDGDISNRITISGSVNTVVPGTYTLTYSVSDSAGLSSSINRVITVIRVSAPTNQPPAISLIGASRITLNVGDRYVEQGATASDQEDGDITSRITIDSNVDTSNAGTYSVTYQVSDSTGSSISKSRTVIVIQPSAPNSAPEITLIGDAEIELIQGTEYEELGATANDAEDGDLTESIQIDASALNIKTPGVYEIIYRVTDSEEETRSVTRTVTVVANQAPVITLNGGTEQVTLLGGEYLELGATAIDEEDGDLTDSIIIDTSDLNLDEAGTYIVTYSVTDSANKKVSTERTVQVIDAGNGPTLSLSGPPTVTISLGMPFFDPGYSAQNSQGQDISAQVNITGEVDSEKVGVYTLHYEISETVSGLNLVRSLERQVIVETLSCPDDCASGCIQLAAYYLQCAEDLPSSEMLSNAVDIEVSQQECIAPCGVHFKANINGDFQVERPFHHLAYHWNFDDPSSYFRNLNENFEFGRGASRAQGPIAAHVFEEPGDYTVQLSVASKQGRYHYKTINIRVLAPEREFSANQTICFSEKGEFDGCPNGASHYEDWATLKTDFNRMDDVYLLFHAGETITVGEPLEPRGNDYVITRYGYGDDPVLWLDGDFGQAIRGMQVNSMSISYLNFLGSYDSATGLGDGYKSYPIYVGWGSTDTNNVTVYRNQLSGIKNCFRIQGGNGLVYTDNWCTNWQDYGSLQANARKLAYVGNKIKQSESARSGPGTKIEYLASYQADGTAKEFAYNFSDTTENFVLASHEDLAVRTISDSGDIVYYEHDQDYSLDIPSEIVTFNQAPENGLTIEIFHRRWADHGPIRVSEAYELVISQNDLFSNVGWFGEGLHHNPALRYNTNAVANHSGVIVENLIEGGTMAAVFEGANTRIGSNPGELLVERNIFTGTSSTYFGVRVAFGGSTFRNNVIQQPPIRTITNNYDAGLYFWENYSEGNGADPANFELPVEVYNNTIVNLSDDNLGSISQPNTYRDFLDVVNHTNHLNEPTFKNFTNINSLSYAPLANNADYHANPLLDQDFYISDESNFMATEDSPGLFDTLWGYGRTESTPLGATQTDAFRYIGL